MTLKARASSLINLRTPLFPSLLANWREATMVVRGGRTLRSKVGWGLSRGSRNTAAARVGGILRAVMGSRLVPLKPLAVYEALTEQSIRACPFEADR